MTFRFRCGLNSACGPLLAAVVVMALSATTGLAQGRPPAAPAGAAPQPGRVRLSDAGTAAATSPASPSAPAQAATIRLHHLAAPWSKVLQELADDAGLTLVMYDVPAGRFTRNDWHKHSRDEAVRIVNRDLEPLGFRVLANDKFLTVIRIERARVEYPRRETETAPRSEASGIRTADYDEPASTAPPRIQRLSAEEPAVGEETQIPESSRIPATPGPSVQTPAAAAPVSARFVPQNRPALEISRDVFAAFELRSTIQERGPNGFPAFTTWRDGGVRSPTNSPSPPTSAEWFTLELDTEGNAIVVTAQPAVLGPVQELLRRLDAAPRTDGVVTRVVAGGPELPGIGQQLRPQLGKLKGSGTGGARTVAWQANGQPVPEQAAPPAAPAPSTPSTEEGLLPLIGNLRGDVNIRSVDELNLLIITGNEADVEQVLRVIELIEARAQGSQPEIRLLNLSHVSSEQLATLLTDVYQRLTTQQERTGRTPPAISIVPVVQPNAILILAPATAIDSILSLAEELDKPADPAAELNVYRLKHAIASEVVTLLERFYQDRPGLGTRVRVIADARTNSLIIQARPRDLAEVELLIKQVDRDDARAAHQARVIQLQHASATELAQFLTTALQSVINPPTTTAVGAVGVGGGGQNAQQLRDAKSVVLEFLQTNGDVQRLVRSGLLTDIRINGDPRTNTLLVTAPRESIAMIVELARALDQPSTAVAAVKMFPLKNADAVTAVEILTSLFEPQQQNQLGVQLAGAESASSLIPLRFQSDPRSNTVIAYGSDEALVIVEAVLTRLDTSDARNRRHEVLKLRNAPAADVAAAINTFLQSQRDLLQLDPSRVSTFELLEQEVIVTPEPVNNYLLISATPRYFDRIMAIARQLDADPPQVMIQALLVEVVLDDTDEFGVELGFQDPILFARSVIDNLVTTTTSTSIPGVGTTQTTNIISQSSTPGFLFNNQQIGNNTAVSPSKVGTQGLSNFALGRTNTDLGFGGLVLAASSESVSVLIRALAARRNVRILSRPQVLALDGQPASIQVGQQVPIVNGVTVTATGQTNPNIIQDQAGIILTVQPRISPEGEIVMVVAAEKSAFTGAGVPIFTNTTGEVITSPIKDITTASTTVKVPDGQTIVVGGMITKSDETIERKVPWLGDLPLVKHLFRYDAHDQRRTELLIFLTPRIVHGDGDAELIKQVEADRLHFFEEEAEAIHGPLFGVPPEQYYLGPLEGNMLPSPEAIYQQPPLAPPPSSSPSSRLPAGSASTSRGFPKLPALQR
jgi:general secretion pathway protein D